MNITVIGTGFVGVVTAAVYASFGHQVIGLDIDPKKIKSLQAGKAHFFEPGLTELLKEQQKNGHLSFTTSYKTAIQNAEVIMISVGTPSAPDDQADLKYVLSSAQALAPFLQKDAIVAIKSTVPPSTSEKVAKIIKAKTKALPAGRQVKFHMASLPEFLREGSAVADTLHPDRVVIGAKSKFVFNKLEKLHLPFKAPILKTSLASAQMAKYAANTYLATRITFANQIADLCEKNGADVQEVVKAIGFDKRIGQHYWYPGLGYGGSCFPKDVKEMAAYSRAVGEADNLFNKINDLNNRRMYRLLNRFAQQIGDWKNKTIAVLGLSFKPNTDDVREAPAIKVIPYLLHKGSTIQAYDPKASFPTDLIADKNERSRFKQSKTLIKAIKDVDVIMALVEWPQIVNFDFAKGRTDKVQWFIDGRNQFDPDQMSKLGFKYIGIGRS